MDKLRIETDSLAGGTKRVSVRGELDAHGARQLERALLATLGRGATEVIVDVTSCDFVDSTALDLIFSPRLNRFRTRFLPVVSDRNILQLLRWQGGSEQVRGHG